jgi:phage tail sheath protein FI
MTPPGGDAAGGRSGNHDPGERGPDESIERLTTALTAFVGRTLRGPVNRPVLIRGFAEFQQVFGGLWQPSLLGYAVEQFFDNGGEHALIVRVVNGARSASVELKAGTGKLVLRALHPGTREFLRVCVDYDNIAAGNATDFNLTVQRVRAHGTEKVQDQETFRSVSIDPVAPNRLPAALAGSQLVELAAQMPAARPDRTLDPASGLATGYVHSNSDGDDGGPLTDYDLIGSATEQTGLFALQRTGHFNLLCIPPLSREQDVGPSALLVAARFCRERRALLIVDPPARWHTAGDALRSMRDWNLASEDALMYFPRILAHDKLRGRFESFAPCGAVAGMLSRADQSSPLWGPAQGEDVVLRPGYRPSCMVAEDFRARLASLGVNAIQAVRPVIRSNLKLRTLAAGAAREADWKYLAARRLALFIVNSIAHGTRWVVRARPHMEVAALVESQVRAFFERLHEAGAFPGRSAEDSYFVICDRRVNAADSARSRFRLLIGFAAARLGEFHSYRITHSSGGSDVSPVTLNRLKLHNYNPQEPPSADPADLPAHIQ